MNKERNEIQSVRDGKDAESSVVDRRDGANSDSWNSPTAIYLKNYFLIRIHEYNG